MSGIAMRYDFAYIGPSWAVQSYSSPRGLEDKIKINIGVMFSENLVMDLDTIKSCGYLK